MTSQKTRRDPQRIPHGSRGRGRPDWQVRSHPGPPPGTGVVTASPDEVMAAVQAVPMDLPWEALRDRVMPLFVRLRPYPAGSPEPVRTFVPLGVSVGFGLDIGPAFLTVGTDMLERWGIPLGELTARAMGNLQVLAQRVRAEDVIHERGGRMPIDALQATGGIGSALVLVPDELARVFGPQPRLFLAPMRPVLLGLPADVDRGVAAWWYAEFAAQDPNCLAPLAFRYADGEVTVEPLGDPAGRA